MKCEICHLNDATRAMVEHGSLSAADLPDFFRERCTGLEGFVTAVNGELRSRSYLLLIHLFRIICLHGLELFQLFAVLFCFPLREDLLHDGI